MSLSNNICHFCLSSDRILKSVLSMQNLIQDLKLWELINKFGGICFECRQMIFRFHQFKLRIITAQYTLGNLKPLVEDLKSLSGLSNKTTIEINIESLKDPLNATDDLLGVKIESVKQGCEGHDSYNDLKDDSDVFVDAIPTDVHLSEDNNSATKMKDSPLVLNRDDTHDKGNINNDNKSTLFEMIKLNEEDMLREREHRRNKSCYTDMAFKCMSCIIGFDAESGYKAHNTQNHVNEKNPYVCDICEIRFKIKYQLERHRGEHYKAYRCILCEYTNCELANVLQHCRQLHKKQLDLLRCDNCKHDFLSNGDLTHNQKQDLCIKCPKNETEIKSSTRLQMNFKRLHSQQAKYTCDICKRIFKCKKRLDTHIKTHSDKLALRQAYCSKCNVQYKNKYIYKSHLRNSANHAQELYNCTDCESKFSSKSYMKKHYDFYHLKKSKFECKDCDKLFISEWRLKSHRQTYHGLARSRKYECSKCGKKFFSMATLKSHQLTHSEERKYMCSNCGDTFKQSAALYTHMKLVHKSKKGV